MMVGARDLRFIWSALQGRKFIYAKTMPEHPHFYTLRKDWRDDDLFDHVVCRMRACGYTEMFYKKPFTRFDLNEWKYWTMGSPVEETILINRAERVFPVVTVLETQPDKWLPRFLADLWSLDPIERWPGRWLDLHCRFALSVPSLLVENYVGFDIAGTVLDQTKAILHANGIPGEVYRTDFNGFYDGLFDFIVAGDGAGSFLNFKLLPRLLQFLAPGGRYAVTVDREESAFSPPPPAFLTALGADELVERDRYMVIHGSRRV
jgi:hypothetical protein